MSFAPDTPGTHSATISIASNDPDEALFTLVLHGVANANAFHAAAASACDLADMRCRGPSLLVTVWPIC